jgi:hypothetical protein
MNLCPATSRTGVEVVAELLVSAYGCPALAVGLAGANFSAEPDPLAGPTTS